MAPGPMLGWGRGMSCRAPTSQGCPCGPLPAWPASSEWGLSSAPTSSSLPPFGLLA